MEIMLSNSIGENPTIALRSNSLTVDGNTMRADVLKNAKSERLAVSGEELSSLLLLGRYTILQGTEQFYHQQVLKSPGLTVVRPSIWTAQLGTTAQTDGRNSQVFTEAGYANGGVNMSADEIKPNFHGHWYAVLEAGFLPEVRRTFGGDNGGSWLLLRKPSLPEVLHHWFRIGDDIDAVAETASDEDKQLEQLKLRKLRVIGEAVVDRVSEEMRSRKQIGLILSMAAIKSTLGDRDGYKEEVGDALTYANNDSRIDASTVRAIENSTFELEQ